ncbi:MAG: sugar ABC transporter ATP-binding protein [Lachnospiraceae bacterium]|nr:sugar ABC transporter ATP-binding protein [Lachnospiraceae bacterium]
MNKTKTVEIKHMSKRFGPTVALNDVSFEAYRGEILGLIGENGSGKSTSTSIFAGMQAADEGEMFFLGEAWAPKSMTDALKQGVGMIVQESGTVAGITVAENIFLGETKEFMRGPFVDRKRMFAEAQKALDQIGAGHIRAEMVTAALDFQDRKLSEIAKVMAQNPTVLVVDETTTALSQMGRDIIYGIMNRMKEEDKTVIFISHDLDEIMEKCDRLTVLRDGQIIRTFTKEEFDADQIRTSMIGRELSGSFYRNDFDSVAGEEVVLEADDLCLGNQLDHLSLKLHAGEILGIGGLSHCGMHTLGKVLFAAEMPEAGTFTVHGKTIRNEAEAMRESMGYVAKDRDVESLCVDASIKDNISVAGLDKFAVKNFLILPSKEKKYVDAQVEALRIKCRDADQYVSALSGGNKQKVAFSKWTGRDSEILILDCPTRGVDIGVKQAMYQLMDQMRKEGKSILLISEEMAELIGMSDRLLVMKDGKVQKELLRSPALSEADVITYMI